MVTHSLSCQLLQAQKAAMHIMANPATQMSAAERVERVIALLETLRLSSYTPTTFPLSDADACDIIGNAAVAICLVVSPVEDNFSVLQARVAGSGELLHTVLHRGMGHPGTASLYPSGAKWMSKTAAALADADGFQGQAVDPSRCCGMLCAQMLNMLGAGCTQYRRPEVVEAVRRDIAPEAAAVEWLLDVGTKWRWGEPKCITLTPMQCSLATLWTHATWQGGPGQCFGMLAIRDPKQ
jgi:hypothetical protein